jgi:hypothetical protein
MTRSWKSWVPLVLFVAAWAIWRETWGWEWEYPTWARWFGIAVPFVIGCVILIYPKALWSRRPLLARACGALLVAVAARGAYLELTGARG